MASLAAMAFGSGVWLPSNIQGPTRTGPIQFGNSKDGLLFEVVNVSHLFNNLETLLKRSAHGFLVQETSAHPKHMKQLRDKCRAARCKATLGPTIPNTSKTYGGVGGISLHPRTFLKVKPATQHFAKAVASGRVLHMAYDAGGGVCLSFYCIYVCTGGHDRLKDAACTNDLVKACCTEIDAQPHSPTFFVGDVNADTCDIAQLKNLLSNGWVDLGSVGHIWGRPDNDYTCVAPGTSTANRRDIILANPMGFPMVKDFNVVHDTSFKVHSILQMQLDITRRKQTYRKLHSPLNFTQVFTNHFDGWKTSGANETDKEKAARWGEAKYRLHAYMERNIGRIRNKLDMANAAADTTGAWTMLCDAINDSLIQHCSIAPSERKWHKGRGKVVIRQTTTKGSATINRQKEILEDGRMPPEAKRLQRQAARVSQLADLYKVRAKATAPPAKAIALIRHGNETIRAIVEHHDVTCIDEHTFAKAITLLNFTEPLHIAQLRKHSQELKAKAEIVIKSSKDKGSKRQIEEQIQDPHLKRAYKQISTAGTPPITHLRRATNAEGVDASVQSGNLQKQGVLSPISRDRPSNLKVSRPEDASVQQRQDGKVDGKGSPSSGRHQQCQGGFATHPDEVDHILRQAWSKIYNGTKKNLHTLVEHFMAKYADYIFVAPEQPQEPIDANKFQHHCIHVANTAGGMDGWRPEDFKLLSPLAFKAMADILNAIEAGAPWPAPLLNGRAAFLAKDPEQLEDPLGYRPLLVLPVLYRCWAGYRLHTLQPWVKEWCTANTFAGVPSMGADDAW